VAAVITGFSLTSPATFDLAILAAARSQDGVERHPHCLPKWRPGARRLFFRRQIAAEIGKGKKVPAALNVNRWRFSRLSKRGRWHES